MGLTPYHLSPQVDPERPVLVDKYLDRADELDVDALCDKDGNVTICGIMQHIEQARHSDGLQTWNVMLNTTLHCDSNKQQARTEMEANDTSKCLYSLSWPSKAWHRCPCTLQRASAIGKGVLQNLDHVLTAPLRCAGRRALGRQRVQHPAADDQRRRAGDDPGVDAAAGQGPQGRWPHQHPVCRAGQPGVRLARIFECCILGGRQ